MSESENEKRTARAEALFKVEFQLRLAAEVFATSKSENTRRALRGAAIAYAAIAKGIR